MKRKEENRSFIGPSCTFFKPSKINFLLSNRVLDRKPDRVTGYKVLIDLTSLDYKVYVIWTFCCTANKAYVEINQWFYWISNPQF